MSIWWLAPVFVGLVGVLMLVGGMARLFRLKVMSGGFRILFGGLTLAGAAVIGLVGLNLQTYSRLTYEQAVAEITLKQVGPNQFIASVRKGDDKGVLSAPQEFRLAGDKVRLEARVWKMKPWANVVGADSFYRLERIQGRWDDPVRENATPSTADDSIRDDSGVDMFNLGLGKYNPMQLDTAFGSGVYMPMVDGAIYDVTLTQSAMIARGKNEIATQALNTWSNNVAPRTPGLENSGEVIAEPPPLQVPSPAPQQ
jgi:hypothetical protein